MQRKASIETVSQKNDEGKNWWCNGAIHDLGLTIRVFFQTSRISFNHDFLINVWKRLGSFDQSNFPALFSNLFRIEKSAGNFDLSKNSCRFMSFQYFFALRNVYFFPIKHRNQHSKMNHQMELLFCPQTNWPISVLEYLSSNPFSLISFWGLS